TLAGHTDIVNALVFSPGGKTLASGGWDKLVKLWDVAAGKERTTLRGHTEAVAALAFAPGGRQLATGGLDKQVKTWAAGDTPGGARLVLKAHDENARFAV